MIETFEINNFKKFASLRIENLNRINFLLGNNNAGKTTVLEAILGFCCGSKLETFIPLAILRNNENNVYGYSEQIMSACNSCEKVPLEFSFRAKFDDGRTASFSHSFKPTDVFSNLNPDIKDQILKFERSKSYTDSFSSESNTRGTTETKRQIHLGQWTIIGPKKSQLTIKLYFPPQFNSEEEPYMLAKYTDTSSHRSPIVQISIYSSLLRQSVKEEFMIHMKSAFPDIADIIYVPYPDGSPAALTVIDVNNKRIPLQSYGDGMLRWFTLVGEQVAYKKSIHCIEEIDATFHPNAQKEIAQELVRLSHYYDNQLFLSCHDVEFLDTFLQTVNSQYGPDLLDSVRVVTLKGLNNSKTIATRVLSGKEALEARKEFELELRG